MLRYGDWDSCPPTVHSGNAWISSTCSVIDWDSWFSQYGLQTIRVGIIGTRLGCYANFNLAFKSLGELVPFLSVGLGWGPRCFSNEFQGEAVLLFGEGPIWWVLELVLFPLSLVPSVSRADPVLWFLAEFNSSSNSDVSLVQEEELPPWIPDFGPLLPWVSVHIAAALAACLALA